MNKTKRVCQICGNAFNGSADMLYCPVCTKIKRSEGVIHTRTCIDCGQEFEGGPKAKRCPSCRRNVRTKHPTIRPLGSIDACVICGEEYSVLSGKQKYCSKACQRIGVLNIRKNIIRSQKISPKKESDEILVRKCVIIVAKVFGLIHLQIIAQITVARKAAK